MKKFYIGIDFGKTNVRYAICENEPELKYYTKEPYSRGSAEEMHLHPGMKLYAAFKATAIKVY